MKLFQQDYNFNLISDKNLLWTSGRFNFNQQFTVNLIDQNLHLYSAKPVRFRLTKERSFVPWTQKILLMELIYYKMIHGYWPVWITTLYCLEKHHEIMANLKYFCFFFFQDNKNCYFYMFSHSNRAGDIFSITVIIIIKILFHNTRLHSWKLQSIACKWAYNTKCDVEKVNVVKVYKLKIMS